MQKSSELISLKQFLEQTPHINGNPAAPAASQKPETDYAVSSRIKLAIWRDAGGILDCVWLATAFRSGLAVSVTPSAFVFDLTQAAAGRDLRALAQASGV